MSRPDNKLIVALDVPTAEEARELVNKLGEIAGMFKIGSQLFTAAGPRLVREIVNSGARVFLDLKFHDIPNTVAAAAVEATRLNVSILNVHAAGGTEMMKRTAQAVSATATAEGIARPMVIAVTVLTSHDESSLVETGMPLKPADLTRRLAQLAEAAEMDGVVASPHEVQIVRSAVSKTEFLIVTPGVRPGGAALHDQARIATPRDAILAGADYIVVGRPIIQSHDPLETARQILAEIDLNPVNQVS